MGQSFLIRFNLNTGNVIYMTKRKGVLQKVSLVSAVISFVLALISAVMLYLRLESMGSDDLMSASFMASTFFFISVGVVLTIIGKADLPSFKIDISEADKGDRPRFSNH
jgi:tetrahydromethanopterin S-methyltransferase subunit D